MRFYLAEAFVELRTDNTKLNAGLQAARKETEKTVTIFSRMKGAAMGALGMLGAAGSAAVAVYFIQRLVRMAAEAEQQTMRFNSALRGAGVASAKMREEISASVDVMKRKYVIDDDVIRQAMTLALNMGVTADQISAVTEAAIGLSEITGNDLNTSIGMVTKALYGNYTALGKVLPEVKAMATEEEKLAALQRISAEGLNQRKDAMSTVAGASDRLSNAFGDLGEIIGGNISETWHLEEALNGVAWAIEYVNDLLEQSGDKMNNAGAKGQKAMHQIKQATDPASKSIMRFFEANANGAKGMAQEIEAAEQKAAKAEEEHRKKNWKTKHNPKDDEPLDEKIKRRNKQAVEAEEAAKKSRRQAELRQKAHDDQVNVERMGPDAKRQQGQARGSRLHDEAGDLAARVAAQIEAAYRRAQAVTEARDPANAATSRAKTAADIVTAVKQAIDGMMEGVAKASAAERERGEKAARGLENNPDYKRILEAIERNTKNNSARFN